MTWTHQTATDGSTRLIRPIETDTAIIISTITLNTKGTP
jgi:hypothetical protein